MALSTFEGVDLSLSIFCLFDWADILLGPGPVSILEYLNMKSVKFCLLIGQIFLTESWLNSSDTGHFRQFESEIRQILPSDWAMDDLTESWLNLVGALSTLSIDNLNMSHQILPSDWAPI